MLRETSVSSRLLTGACLAACSLAFGCASGTQPASEDFEVVSNAEQGLLARIAYDDGHFVEFLSTDHSVFIGAVLSREGKNPLAGVELSKAMPSELFTYLTGREAPAALVSAEREAGFVSNPEAFASVEPAALEGDLGMTSQALLSSQDFIDQYCVAVDYCGTDLWQEQTISSPGRMNSAHGAVDVYAGSGLRFRVKTSQPAADKTLVNYVLRGGDFATYSGKVHGIDRHLNAIVDQVSAAYHLSVNFRD